MLDVFCRARPSLLPQAFETRTEPQPSSAVDTIMSENESMTDGSSVIKNEVTALYSYAEVGGPVLADRSPVRSVIPEHLEGQEIPHIQDAYAPSSHENGQDTDAVVLYRPPTLPAADAVLDRPVLPDRSPVRSVVQVHPEAERPLHTGDAPGPPFSRGETSRHRRCAIVSPREPLAADAVSDRPILPGRSPTRSALLLSPDDEQLSLLGDVSEPSPNTDSPETAIEVSQGTTRHMGPSKKIKEALI